eukprot:scaffold153_cov347-Pavlova_lutheri.AAC.29
MAERRTWNPSEGKGRRNPTEREDAKAEAEEHVGENRRDGSPREKRKLKRRTRARAGRCRVGMRLSERVLPHRSRKNRRFAGTWWARREKKRGDGGDPRRRKEHVE